MPQRFRMVVTSDRYDFSVEHEMAAQSPDLEIDLAGIPCATEDELIAAGAEADALLPSTREAITASLLDHLPNLKVISRYGVGLDNVDLEAATARGVVVTHYPQYCTAEVADHALALILALNRRLVELDRDLRDGAWNRYRHHTQTLIRGPIPPLRELTLGIVGFGRIGQAVATRAQGFGLTLLATDPYLDPKVIQARGATPVGLDELLARADIVTIHCPLTPETRGLFNAAALAQMKPTAVLINTARGPIVEQAAITAALHAGELAAAALDVFETEPLPEASPLYDMPNVILTPHSAYYSERSVELVRTGTFAAALAVLRGEQPETVANPAVLDRVHLRPRATS